MTKYAKLIDNTLQYAQKVIRVEGKTFINPNAETLKAYGYYPVVETERPTADEGYLVTSAGYALDGDAIVRKWRLEPKPVSTDKEISTLRASAYRDRVDPITCEISRLRDMGGTEEEIAEAMARRDAEVARIKEELPYSEDAI